MQNNLSFTNQQFWVGRYFDDKIKEMISNGATKEEVKEFRGYQHTAMIKLEEKKEDKIYFNSLHSLAIHQMKKEGKLKMNELQVFKFNERQVRTQSQNDDIWFCLKDVCDILEIANQNNVVSRLNQKGIHTMDTPTKGGMQKMNFINESNLYKVIFQSRKPQAEAFTEWVTSEVLPTIRRTGAYNVPTNPMDALKLMFEAQTQTNQQVGAIAQRVQDLEDNKLLDPGEYNYISKAVRKKAKEVMDALNMDLIGKQKNQVYHAINRDLNAFVGIRTRTQFKQKDFDKALEFIQNWQLSYTDKKIIEQLSFNI